MCALANFALADSHHAISISYELHFERFRRLLGHFNLCLSYSLIARWTRSPIEQHLRLELKTLGHRHVNKTSMRFSFKSSEKRYLVGQAVIRLHSFKGTISDVSHPSPYGDAFEGLIKGPIFRSEVVTSRYLFAIDHHN